MSIGRQRERSLIKEWAEPADLRLRRREEIGVSYVSVNSAFCEQFAPVVELLAGG